jgi:hypothetical protein
MWFSYTPNREAFALRRANHILAIQENEATYYRYLTPGNDVRVVFMTFPFHPVGSTAQNKSLLFFSGSNEYNIHGIKDFVEKIFPKVTEIWNDAKLIIGGSISKYLDEYKDNKSIKVVGQVDDPKDFYKLGQVVINPTFEGTGLKVKTFEAVSYGKVVLVHHHSLEGIFNKDHAPVYECNSANDYIRKLKEVWSGSYDFKAQSQKCNTYLSDMDKYIERMYQQILG